MMKSRCEQDESVIKHALIDLLHEDKDISYDALSKITGLAVTDIKSHEGTILAMLTKLKKIDNFKQ